MTAVGSTKIPLFLWVIFATKKVHRGGELVSWRAVAFQVWNYFVQENEKADEAVRAA